MKEPWTNSVKPQERSQPTQLPSVLRTPLWPYWQSDNICCSPAPCTSRPGRESGQSTPRWLASSTAAWRTSQTAGTPTACTADGSVADSLGRVVPRGRRHELLSLWGLRFFTEWTRLTWAVRRSPTGRPGATHWLATSSGSNFAAGVGRRISVLTQVSKDGAVLPSTPVVWRLVLSALLRPSYCADSLLWGRVFVVGAGVRASRGIPAFKQVWGRSPGGPEDSLVDTK